MNDESKDEESSTPKKQLETDRSSGSGRPPADTTVGLSDGDPGPGQYRVGQRLKVLIIEPRSGGYDVLIEKDGVRAYLIPSKKYEQGAVLFGEFRYWQDVN